MCGPLGPFLSFAFESAALPAFAGWQNNAPRNLAFLDLVDNVGIISQITPTFVTNGLSVLQSVSVVCLFDRIFACEFQGYSESLKECFLNVVSCIGRRDQGKSFREQLPGVPTAHEINLVTTVEQKFAVTLFDNVLAKHHSELFASFTRDCEPGFGSLFVFDLGSVSIIMNQI